jgi:hypothetical protein
MTSRAVEPSTADLNCSTGLEAQDDGGALLGDAFALESFGLGFGLLDLENFFGFAAGLGGGLFALRGVDVVHSGFDFGVGDHVGDERFEDVVAELAHDGVELAFDGGGDLRLLLEGLVEGEGGDVAKDGVEDVALDLFLRGAELVVGLENLVGEDLVLDRDGNGDEDVVFGFGFDVDVGLADLEVHEADGFAPRHEEVEAGLGDAIEFAEALDDARGVGADGVHGLDDSNQDEDARTTRAMRTNMGVASMGRPFFACGAC